MNIVDGWVFYSADFSIQSGEPHRPGTVLIKRDRDGAKWWHSLSEDEQEKTPLYMRGYGMTLEDAILDAISEIS